VPKPLILFDFDGVIADTFTIAHGLAREYVSADLTPDEYRAMFHGNIHEVTSKKLAHLNYDDHQKDWYAQYAPLLQKQKIFAGVEHVITTLAPTYALVIISSAASQLIIDYLNQHQLRHYFDEILGSDVHTSKVEKIRSLQQDARTSPADMLMITDTLGDIREATKAGVDSIGVSWGFHTTETLLQGQPVAVVDTPEELLVAITTYFE
jgi:HAD superfamily hydrolase (TIGR01549 family)